MTHKANTLKNGISVRHNPGEGTHPSTEWCPSVEVLERFCVAAKGLRAAGRPVPSIRELFPEEFAGRPPGNRSARRLDEPAEYTIDEWLGTPENPGPFFRHVAALKGAAMASRQRVNHYTYRLHTTGAHMVGRRLSEITPLDAQRYIDLLHVCPACERRAQKAGRSDLTDRPDVHLLAVNEPWDGACEGPEGSTHQVRCRKTTIREYLSVLRYAFDIAKECGEGPIPVDPRCPSVMVNPFRHVRFYKFKERETAHDHAFALSHAEVKACVQAAPAHYRAAILVAAYGALRRSELLGMSRGDLNMPPGDDPNGQAIVRLSMTWLPDDVEGDGKTPDATGTDVVLPPRATVGLRRHLDEWRSTANPDVCTACASGQGEHHDMRAHNPHRGCDFADDAPLWVDPESGRRPDPDQFARMFRRTVKRAGLAGGKYIPGLHTLRATGATLLIESGESIDSVVKHGRWSNRQTLERHYLRPTIAGRMAANAKLNAEIEAAWGFACDAQASLEEQVRQLRIANEALRQENSRLLERLDDGLVAEPMFRPKGWYTEDDLRRELGPALNMTHLCKRLGLKGTKNSREAIRRKMEDGGLEFWPGDDDDSPDGQGDDTE